VSIGQTVLLRFNEFLGFKLCFSNARSSINRGMEYACSDFQKKYTALSDYLEVFASVSISPTLIAENMLLLKSASIDYFGGHLME